MIFVLDSYCLLTLFLNQNGAEIVLNHLNRAAEGGYFHLLSGINYGEVYYQVMRRKGERAAEGIRERISNLPIEVIMPNFEDMISASRLKSGGGISYADCFAATLALAHDVPVLTGDHEFENVEKYGLKIEWLPPNR